MKADRVMSATGARIRFIWFIGLLPICINLGASALHLWCQSALIASRCLGHKGTSRCSTGWPVSATIISATK